MFWNELDLVSKLEEFTFQAFLFHLQVIEGNSVLKAKRIDRVQLHQARLIK